MQYISPDHLSMLPSWPCSIYVLLTAAFWHDSKYLCPLGEAKLTAAPQVYTHTCHSPCSLFPLHYLLLAFCLSRLQAFQIIDWLGLLPAGCVIFPDLRQFISHMWPSQAQKTTFLKVPAFHHFIYYSWCSIWSCFIFILEKNSIHTEQTCNTQKKIGYNFCLFTNLTWIATLYTTGSVNFLYNNSSKVSSAVIKISILTQLF